jgi:hypothetical protein
VDAFLSVLKWWLERGSKLLPFEVDGMFRDIVVNGIGKSVYAIMPQGKI